MARYEKPVLHPLCEGRETDDHTRLRVGNSKWHLFARSLALLSLTTLVSGCETSEDRAYANAQSCLDQAKDVNSANVCSAMVDGLTSQQAYLVRCSANFIAQGLTGARLASAFQSLQNQTPGTNSTSTMLAFMVFDNSRTGNDVTTTINNCQQSGVQSLFRLATGVQWATTIAGLAAVSGVIPSNLNPSDPSFDPTQLTTVLNNLKTGGATDPQKQAIGSSALTANAAFCAAGSNFQSQDICTKLSSAIQAGNNDPTAIGAQLLTLLTQTN